MPEKKYTIEGLFNRLPISISELARKSGISEVTAAGIRDGKTARIHTINRLLTAFSELYSTPLTVDNVEGLHILKGRYGEGKSQKQEEDEQQDEEEISIRRKVVVPAA